ncbi:MAG: hypothetical protein IKX42_11320 [Fibrobacter sp.]|nr:hypothetical protein [Fibrobacter sp.]
MTLSVYKKKGPARRLRQGAVSDKRPVLTGRGRESERAYPSFTDGGSANGL